GRVRPGRAWLAAARAAAARPPPRPAPPPPFTTSSPPQPVAAGPPPEMPLPSMRETLPPERPPQVTIAAAPPRELAEPRVPWPSLISAAHAEPLRPPAGTTRRGFFPGGGPSAPRKSHRP